MPARDWKPVVLSLSLCLLPSYSQSNAPIIETAPTPTPSVASSNEVEELKRALKQAQQEIQKLREENNARQTIGPALPSTPATPTPTTSMVEKPVNPAAEEELRRAQQQIESLRQQNQLLSGQVQQTLSAQTSVYLPPVPLPDLPVVKDDSVIGSADLLAYYRLDPGEAERRFGKKTFRVKGEAMRFSTGFGTRSLSIFLKGDDAISQVEALFRMPERYNTMFTRKKDGALVGRTAEGHEETLLQREESITLEGQNQGYSDHTVILKSCRLVLK